MRKPNDERFEQLQQQKMRDQAILDSTQYSNKFDSRYIYSEEQILQAQKQTAKTELNALYERKIHPTTNGIIYLAYYFFALEHVVIIINYLFGQIKNGECNYIRH